MKRAERMALKKKRAKVSERTFKRCRDTTMFDDYDSADKFRKAVMNSGDPLISKCKVVARPSGKFEVISYTALSPE